MIHKQHPRAQIGGVAQPHSGGAPAELVRVDPRMRALEGARDGTMGARYAGSAQPRMQLAQHGGLTAAGAEERQTPHKLARSAPERGQPPSIPATSE